MLAHTRTITHGSIRIRSLVLLLACSVIIALAGQVATSLGQEQPKEPKAPGAGFPDLIGGLKSTAGCLGVETAKTDSGKNVIFAWFENKQAVLNWYHSETHQKAVKMFFPGYEPGKHKPLKDVPDDSGPIMAVASVTMSDKPQVAGTAVPISQNSIELYRPITGGLFVGGRFAPEKLKVPGQRDLTPEKK